MTAMVERLAHAVGAQHVAGDGERAIVRPGAAVEIAGVLRVAAELGVTVSVGGATAISLDLGRMTQVLHLDETSLLCSVQAGLTAAALDELLAARGLQLPPLPAASRARTLGALMSAPRPAEATPRWGRWSTCAGVAAVLADGTLLETRIAPRKATGPDLMHALIGARGTLGIITAVTVRIERHAEAREEAAWTLPSGDAALACARALLVRGGRPADLTVSLSPAPTLTLTVDGAPALVRAERELAHRLATAHGGQAVPHTPPPLAAAAYRPHERAITLEALPPLAGAHPSWRVVGWHTGGAALVDPTRPPEPPPPAHPLTQALKHELDPNGRLPAWPGAPPIDGTPGPSGQRKAA